MGVILKIVKSLDLNKNIASFVLNTQTLKLIK